MGKHSIGNHKVVCFTLWFATHNNPRHAALLPKLIPVVQFYKVTLSRQRVIQALQYRIWHALKRGLIYPVALRYFSQRFETLFTLEMDQISAWPRHKAIVIDVDDPVFSPTEIRFLNLPNVKAIIVTTERAKEIFQELGVVQPIYVIPQGVSMDQIDPQKVQQICTQFKRDTSIVVGYHGPTLTLSYDGLRRARQGLDDLDLLFAAVKEARNAEQRINLWLLGEPSESVKRYAADEPWIKLFGYIPFAEVLNYVSNFDIGAYPRAQLVPPGRFSVKIAQYLACGIPVVSTNVDESFVVREAGCGIICDSQNDFRRALVELAQSAKRRVELGASGRGYAAANLEWSALVRRYEQIFGY